MVRSKIIRDQDNHYEPKIVKRLFNDNIPKDVEHKLTSELDDIEQVKLRLVAPDATNNSQWFLKPDLVVHPRYAVSELTHRKMLKIREEKEKVVERSICGLPEYYQSFKDRLKIKETLQSDRDKNALMRQKSKLVGRRNLPSVFKSSNENKVYTT